MKKHALLSARLKQYSTFAGVVAASTAAHAQIVYTDVNPDVVIDPLHSSYNLDLNGDGEADFTFYAYGNTGQGGFKLYMVDFFNYNGGRELIYPNSLGTGSTARQLNYGYAINSADKKWANQAVFATLNNTAWNGQEKYVGFHTSFPSEPHQHYGWMRIAVQADFPDHLSITLKDFAYNVVTNQTILAGQQSSGVVCSDSYEPNNSFTQATPLNANQQPALSMINPAADKDFYQITVAANQPNVQVILSGLPLNYDMSLYDAQKNKLQTAKNKKKVNDTLVYNNAAAGTYYVKVYQKDNQFDDFHCYTLTVKTAATPFKIDETTTADAVSIHLFPNPASEMLTVQFNNELQTETPVTVFDLEGREIMRTVFPSGETSSQLNISSLSPGMYLLRTVVGNEVVMKKFMVEK